MINRTLDRWIKYLCKTCTLIIHWDSKSNKVPTICPRCQGKEVVLFNTNKTEVVIK